MTVCSVGDHAADERARSVVAQVLTTRRAVAAAAAGGYERRRHVIARLNGGDTRAHFHHDTGTLVATDHREEVGDAHHLEHLLGRNHVAGDEVFVGVTQARSAPVHEHFAGLGRMHFDLFDRPRLIEPPENSGSRLADLRHGTPPNSAPRTGRRTRRCSPG